MEHKDNRHMHMHMHGMGKQMSKEEEEFLEGALGKGSEKVIAEMGCGAGYYCKYLSSFASKLYCVDINKDAINAAKDSLSNINSLGKIIFLNESASNTSINEKSVDIVLFANSFHDMDPKKNEVVSEVRRILKPGGTVIIIDWEKKATEFGPPLDLRMSKDEYKSYFSGFIVEKEESIGLYHYAMLLRA